MVGARGFWAWWNQYSGDQNSVADCVERASKSGIRGVIVKCWYWDVMKAFQEAGIPVAVEKFVYPGTPRSEGAALAEGIRRGGRFAVINAEAAWENVGPEPMEELIAEFRRDQPVTALYASVDTRGGRMELPYQRVLVEHVAGWMPMIYPKAFGQSVAAAFAVSLDGKDFRDLPVLPTIQTYDRIGKLAVHEQVEEVRHRGLPGCQAYTIGHATAGEWAAFVEPLIRLEEEPMLPLAVLREEGDPWTRAWVTDGFRRYWYKSPEGLKTLVEAGVLPETVVVPKGALADIEVVAVSPAG